MKNITVFLIGLFLLFGLVGCQTMPNGFSQQQLRVLQQQGFEPIGDEWILSLSALILFSFDDNQLNDSSRGQVQQLGKSLWDVGINRVRVEGHADSQGDPEYNRKLSQQRAEAVASEISALGLPTSAIQVLGMGSHYPVATNDTSDGRAQNRRVTIIVSP